MSEKKQSSIDWFIQQFNGKTSRIANMIGVEKYNSIIDQAKAMHKEETVDLIVQYEIKHHLIFTEEGILNIVKKAEKYYNETFGGRHE